METFNDYVLRIQAVNLVNSNEQEAHFGPANKLMEYPVLAAS